MRQIGYTIIWFITLHWYPPKTVRETICMHSTLNNFVFKITFLMTSSFLLTQTRLLESSFSHLHHTVKIPRSYVAMPLISIHFLSSNNHYNLVNRPLCCLLGTASVILAINFASSTQVFNLVYA